MSFQDWIFALHLLTAATLVGGMVASWIIIVSLRSADAAETVGLSRVAMVGTGAIMAGLPGTIILGIWLAALRPQLHPWHGWAVGAIVLWAIAAVAILRSLPEYAKPVAKAKELVAAGKIGPNAELTALNRTVTGLLLRAVASAAIVLIVIDMIYKPGA